MSWFETWFDSEYYHKLYQSRNDDEAEFFITNLLRQLNFKPNDSILDLACGKGRHAVFLNEKGFNVTGVDLSENSINSAKSKENDSLKFMVKDMRDAFTENEFDGIFNLFTSFGYFDSTSENLKVLNSIETMLKKDGVFVIDFMNANKVINSLVVSEDKTIDNLTFHISRKVENGNIIKQIEFTDNDQSHSFQEKVQALFLDDFKTLLDKTNLKIDSIFGDYNLNPFDEVNSDRLILVGSKK